MNRCVRDHLAGAKIMDGSMDGQQDSEIYFLCLTNERLVGATEIGDKEGERMRSVASGNFLARMLMRATERRRSLGG